MRNCLLPTLGLLALALPGLPACGGTPGSADDDASDDDVSVPEPTPTDTTPEPQPVGTPEPSDEPILTPDEPEAPPAEPAPTATPVAPCESLSCNPGQRCDETTGVAVCMDNTCETLMCSATEVCEPHELGGNVCVDNGCVDDVDCVPAEHCGANGVCTVDVCQAQTRTCSGNDVFQCTSSGSSDDLAYTCASEAYFTSECSALTPETTGCSCEDDWDCPAFTNCEVSLCQGTGFEPTCKLPPIPFTDTPPTVEIHWGGDSADADLAHDGSPEQNPAPWAEFSHVQATPMVANLDDDNGDGLVNELDFPEIVFVTYPAGAPARSILRAIHGGGPDKGKDLFAVCGDTVWHKSAPFDTTTTPCSDEGAEIPSRNAAAIGDLDGDGVPEIVYGTSNGNIRILDNAGNTLYLSAEGMLEEPQAADWGTQPSIANLDFLGFPELIFGREVYTLTIGTPVLSADAGVATATEGLLIEHHLSGGGTRGQHGPMGPTSCVADLHSGAGQEILAGSTLYRMPALAACATPPCAGALEVVWDAAALNPELPQADGYCAVADVWGADPTLSPSVDNPPDGMPEAILIANGILEIFDGATGATTHVRDLDPPAPSGNNTRYGGAPNVDDFDGDGFMEIASALEDFYVVVDLQDPTDNCPAWPDAMDRVVTAGVEDNPNLTAGLVRDPGGACTASTECNAGATCNTTTGQCVCFHNGWQRNSDDASSRVTSSSVFDFNGDGAAEVLYNDECEFRVYDGIAGEVLYAEISRSRTAMENPVVADVDNDGNAEAIAVLNTEEDNRCDDDDGAVAGPNGIKVWGDPVDAWVSARRIWNQFAYHVTNVTESGSIPLHEPESWQSFGDRTYNTYRSQPRSFGVAPDLQVTGVSLSSPDVACGELGDTLEIAFEITNAGDVRVGPGVEISFYGVWDDMEALLMGPGGPLVYVVQSSLEPGRSLIGSVVFDVADQGQASLPTLVRVEVDTGGLADSDFGAERECLEDNNDATSPVEPGEPRPDLSIVVGEATVDCGTRIATVQVTIENSGTADATGVELEIFAGDPAAGGTSMAVIAVGDVAAGASVTLTAEVPNFPQSRSITLWGVVDPNDTVLECNEADNADPADNPIVCNVSTGAR